MLSSILYGLLAIGAAAAPTQPHARSVNFDWSGSTKVRGLNIGGWLVLEPWITPSIFQNVDQSLNIVDEYTLTQQLGTEAAYNILKPHWDSWCTYSDFQKIANAGFNLVRIPVGYWAYQLVGEPYTQGAAEYIDAAVDWARATGLKILIDLHGAPGSQNGFDNSGHRGGIGWQQGNTISETLDVLSTISKKYAQPSYQDVIVGIEILNEPLGPNINYDQLRQFMYDGYGQTRAVSDTPVIMHDAFFQPKSWNGMFTPAVNNMENVIMDHHEYQVFDNGLIAMSPAQHIQQVCANSASWSGSDLWEIVGEWTGAMTDCAQYLNGYNTGAPYDGTFPGSSYVGSCAGKSDIGSWSAQMRSDTRAYIEAQMNTFESAANGWIWWNFKTEGAGEWDAFRLLDAGIFPQPLTDRQFGGGCS